VLPAGAGYLFGSGETGGPAFDVLWSGGRLTAGASVRFTQPFDADSPEKAAGGPTGEFDLTEVQPRPGSALFVRVASPSGDVIYEIWIPPGQRIADTGGPLTFDFKVFSVAPPPAAAGPLPSVLNDINLAGDVFAGGAGVATTNLMATVAIVLLLLAGGYVFNEALQDTLAGWSVRSIRLPGAVGSPAHRIRSWLAAVGAAWAALIPGHTWIDQALAPAFLLLGTGLIYSLLDPGFGLNETTLTLFISLVISQGVLALAYEGGKAWLYRRHLGVSAGVRLFPASILIAAISVAISRLGDLHPGIVVGFIAAAVLFEREGFSAADRGSASARIAASTLGISIAAWLLAIPLHHLYDASPNLWTALPEATATSIFIVCLEGLLFSLMPLQFMDGWRIWKWNRLAWLALFVPTMLMFMQVLFNAEASYFDFVTSHRSISGIAVIVAYLAATWGTWAYLKWRAEKGEEESNLEPAAEAAP
jgi:hypothetical protein